MICVRPAPVRVCVCGMLVGVGKPGLTYVVQQGRYVKIGTTRDDRTLHNRLRALRQRYGVMKRPGDLDWSMSLALLAVFPVNVEHEVHDACREWHVLGEWFYDEPEIRERIEFERVACL